MATRTRLTRDRILQAGLTLADAGGVEALTMRRLGEELGFEAMSLYRHVANKNDLLDGMLDLVLDEWRLPVPGGDWTAELRASAISVHDSLRLHPWAAHVLVAGGIRPARLRYMEAVLSTFRAGGFGADETYHVYHLLDGHVFGFTLWEIAHSGTPLDDDQVARIFESIPWGEYPNLTEHRDQHMTEGPHRQVRAFEVGLDLILAGLER